jgi:8-oxo-dGTP pyrophosphatase MutT (NUDIX family)
MDGRTDYNAAKIEAYEEAGAEGRIGTTAIGEFEYSKRLKNGACKTCRVAVYPLNVANLARKWPEQSERADCNFASVLRFKIKDSLSSKSFS